MRVQPRGLWMYLPRWPEQGLCRQVGGNMFFPDDTAQAAESMTPARVAAQICRHCPVWRQCRVEGLSESAGVWGGMTAKRRRDLRRDLGIAVNKSWDSHEIVKLRRRVHDAMKVAREDVDAALQHLPELRRQPVFHNFDILTAVRAVPDLREDTTDVDEPTEPGGTDPRVAAAGEQ